jgi:uncharacterized protein (TIGR02996 family)
MASLLNGFLEAIVADPESEDRWLVLADWLEEYDDPRRAELLRLHRKLLATCCEPERHPERGAWQARVVELLGQGVRPAVPQRSVVLAEGVEMTFSFIPPGGFLMGSPEGEEGRDPNEIRHRVTLRRGYFLGVYPVTQAQWRAVTGGDPSKFNGDGRPIETVSWEDCVAFCEKLARKAGGLFRLPTEAEWEFAARAGTTTAYCTGDGLGAMKRAGWCSYHGGARETKLVGQFEPNAWGLYDVHGNVWEWCSDRYGPYPCGPVEDPGGCAGGEDRVRRGGSWLYGPRLCRSAYRSKNAPASRGGSIGNVGCRVVLCPD